MSSGILIVGNGKLGPGSTGGAGAAADVTFTPTGSIAATNVQAAIAEVASEAAAALAAYQPLDSDLTAIAALSTTTFGRGLLTLANQAALVSAVGSATDTTSGVVELATSAEVTTGTDTGRAATPAGVKAAIDAAVAALIASAPGVLDTLDELAAALGDDPNFAATITTALAGKQPLDSDLTAIASLTTTTYGRAFLTLADQAALMALVPAASDTVQGKVELATNAEAATGTDATRAVTPANLASVLASYLTSAAAPELIRDTIGTALVAGSNITLTVNDAGDTITIAASGGGGSALAARALAPITKVGQYSRTYTTAGQSQVGPMVLNRLYYVPFVVPQTITIDRYGISVQTAGSAGALLRIGIYSSDADGLPSALLLDAGTVPADTGGAKELVVNQTLPAGMYWGAAVSQVATCNVHAAGGGIDLVGATFLPWSSLSLYMNAPTLYDTTTVSGALPASPTLGSSAGQVMPIMGYRRSA